MPDSASSIIPYLNTNLQGSLRNMNFLPLKNTGIPISAQSSDGIVCVPLAFPFPCDILKTAASKKPGGKNMEVIDIKMCFWKGGRKGTLIFLLPD